MEKTTSILEIYMKLRAKFQATLQRMSEADREAFEERLRTMARRTLFEYGDVYHVRKYDMVKMARPPRKT